MPAERAEAIYAGFEDGQPPVLLGWIIRISDGDVIGFEAVKGEDGEAVYQLGHHFSQQVYFLEEPEAEVPPEGVVV